MDLRKGFYPEGKALEMPRLQKRRIETDVVGNFRRSLR